jgi:hypothetical protein
VPVSPRIDTMIPVPHQGRILHFFILKSDPFDKNFSALFYIEQYKKSAVIMILNKSERSIFTYRIFMPKVVLPWSLLIGRLNPPPRC